MEKLGNLLTNNHIPKRNNVNVDNNNTNNVYDENVAHKIQDALDKPKAIGEVLAEKLGAPGNLKFYIKLARQYPQAILFECVSLTNEAVKEGRIRKSPSQYFWGIL